jgi:U3 small nucleolar RNA-associated protein 15
MSSSGDFAPVVVRRGLAGPARVGADARKWALTRATSVQLPNSGAISDLTFSPLAPHDVAAASGPSVAILDTHAGSVRRTLARFRDIARSPDYKPDGRLLVAGCDNSTVQLFDMSSRAVLRVFNGHEG